MGKILFSMAVMLIAGFAYAQQDTPDDPDVEREAVIAESFFRRIWSGINSQDEVRRYRTYSRFNLNDQQASALDQSINDWMSRTSSDALSRQEQMCAFWNSKSGKDDPASTADAALDLYDSLEPSTERVKERLQGLIDDIELRLGSDFAAALMQELDKDYVRRKNIKVSSWTSRVRDNANGQLDFTC